MRVHVTAGHPRFTSAASSLSVTPPSARPTVKAPMVGIVPRNATSNVAPASRFRDGTLGGVVVNIYWSDIWTGATSAVDLSAWNSNPQGSDASGDQYGHGSSNAEWTYYRNSLAASACSGVRPPCKVRVFTGVWAHTWATTLDSGSPFSVANGNPIYDTNDDPNKCPHWWKTNYAAAADQLATILATGSSGGVSLTNSASQLLFDGVVYSGLEAMPFVREIAFHPACTAFAEPCQRSTKYAFGPQNISAYIAAGLNDGTATVPNTLDAAALLRPSNSKWVSYGFTTTPMYFAWNPVQQWIAATGVAKTDPGNWTEDKIPVVSDDMTSRVCVGNNSFRAPIANVGQPYLAMYNVMAADNALGTLQRNAFQTAIGGTVVDAYITPRSGYVTPAVSAQTAYRAMKATLDTAFGIVTSATDAIGTFPASANSGGKGLLSGCSTQRACYVELPTPWQTMSTTTSSTAGGTGLTAADGAIYTAAGSANFLASS